MEYTRLGKSGLQISRLSFGSWVTFGHQIQNDTAKELMHLAYDSGINFFDNAEVYAHGASEEVMGKILKEAGWPRSNFLVSSKAFWGGKKPNQNGLSRKHLVEACHAALQRLQVDYLDLYYCHRPDKNTPLEETVFTMDMLIRQGKILYWGTSEWEAATIAEAHAIARREHLIPPIVEQPQYHMFHRERVEIEYRNLYDWYGMGTTTWSPLASGLLTGKYNQGLPENTRASLPDLVWLKELLIGPQAQKNIAKIQALQALAQELNTSLPCLAIAWCLRFHGVSSVILGASKSSQLKENLGAIELSSRLDQDVWQRVEEILDNQPKTPDFG